MAASYPSSAPTFTPLVDGVDYPQADDLQVVYDEVAAIGTALVSGGLAHDLDPDSTAGNRDLGSTAKQWRQLHAKLLNLADASELTVATGAITVTQSYHRVDTESDAASDDLDTITAGTGLGAGALLFLRAENVARVVTLKDGTGNLLLNGDFALSATDRLIALLYDGTSFREVARSVPTNVGDVVNAYHNTTEALTADGPLALNSEDADTAAYHDTGSNTSRITIPAGKAGVYVFHAQVRAHNPGTGTADVYLRKNNTTNLVGYASGTNSGDVTVVSWMGSLAAADYIEIYIDKSDGSSWTFGSATAAMGNRLMATRIGS